MTTNRQRKRRETFGAVRQRDSGRWQAHYLDPTGAVDERGHAIRYYAPSTFSTLTDARAWLKARDVEIQRGEWQSPADLAAAALAAAALRFDAYAREHIETRTNGRGEPLKPRTRAEYLRLLDGPLATFHATPLHQITAAAVRRWNADQLDTGHKTQTARAYLLLKSVLTTAVDDGHLSTNPCQIKGAAKAKTGKSVEPPTDAELAIIMATIDTRLALMVEVAAWGGLRWGELTELRRGDVAIQGQTVTLAIARAVTYTKTGGFSVGAPKSVAGIRSVALPAALTAAVRAQLAKIGPQDNALLFPSLSDPERHFSAGSFAQYWRPAREAADRADMPFHALRHYGATRYALAGATTRELLARMGHNSVDVAMKYQHAVGRDAALAARMTTAASAAPRESEAP